jgi:hypothetical protein
VDFPSLQIELKAGESLYLSSGWFHKVVATIDNTKDDDTTRDNDGDVIAGNGPLSNCRLAVN